MAAEQAQSRFACDGRDELASHAERCCGCPAARAEWRFRLARFIGRAGRHRFDADARIVCVRLAGCTTICDIDELLSIVDFDPR